MTRKRFVAGAGSACPSGAMTRTENRYLPGRSRNAFGDAHGFARAALRTRQVKWAPATSAVTVARPSRLMITGHVGAFKTTSDNTKFARLGCTLFHEDERGLSPVGRRVEATMSSVSVGPVVVSLTLVGSVDVAAGTSDVSIRCEAMDATTNTGVSFHSASVNVIAVPLLRRPHYGQPPVGIEASSVGDKHLLREQAGCRSQTGPVNLVREVRQNTSQKLHDLPLLVLAQGAEPLTNLVVIRRVARGEHLGHGRRHAQSSGSTVTGVDSDLE